MYQMQSKKIYYSLILVAVLAVFLFSVVRAEEDDDVDDVKVDYKNEVVVDSDLDGLTDKGEQQIYGTDSANPDTDGDGYLDGAEVLVGTSASDAQDYPGRVDASVVNNMLNSETPWVWYVGRAAGIIGFIFLWITIFLGLSIRNPLLKKVIEPMYSFDFHCFVAAAAVFWALIHGTSFLFDNFMGFGIKDITIPFYAPESLIHSNPLALGIIAFYAMIIMMLTSYLRSHINNRLWRILHFLNPVAFIFVVVHGYINGTDMKNFWIGGAYLVSAGLLVLVYFSSLVSLIINKFRQRNEY